MNVKLTWTDGNTDETGHRIYRSSSPMDTQALPPPVAELGPDVTEWEDTDTPVDQEAYYIVSAVRGNREAFSDEVMADTGIVPLAWNPDDMSPFMVLSDNNSVVALLSSPSPSHAMVRANTFNPPGDWYVEVTPISGNTSTGKAIGVADVDHPLGFTEINEAGINAFYRPNGQVFSNGGYAGAEANYTNNDVIGVSYSSATGRVGFSKNGVHIKYVTIGEGLTLAPVVVLTASESGASAQIMSSPQYMPAGFTYWGSQS